MGSLKNRIVIVTGASRGIGRSTALAFAVEGANIVATARSADAIDGLAAEIGAGGAQALAVAADVSLEADISRIVKSTVERFGQIDVLVNNAAVIHPIVNLVDFEPDDWRRVLDVNLTAPALLTKAALPGMIQGRSGKIINISSMGGRKGARGRGAYRAAKAGLISPTESVAAEVKEYGIDVNCICSGGVDTEGFREAFNNRGRENNPRLMRPEEIADLAVFLASDRSSAVTGTAIDAFGGSNPLFG